MRSEASRIIDNHRVELGEKVVRLRDEFEPLERRIGYRFRDRGLLEHALTHRSRAHEDVTGGVMDNESLEFLGDAVLGFVMADLLFRDDAGIDEGRSPRSRRRSSRRRRWRASGKRCTSETTCCSVAARKRRGGGRNRRSSPTGWRRSSRQSIWTAASRRRRPSSRRRSATWSPKRAGSVASRSRADYKSGLQEWLQSRGRPLPLYRVAAEIGPDHRKQFVVEVLTEDGRSGELRAAARRKRNSSPRRRR